jgi:hypothetical protein
VKCLNIYKSKDRKFLEKLSLSQKGKPRKKHTEKTKKKLSEISKKMWQDEEKRNYILEKLRNPLTIEKLSKAGINSYKSKNVGKLNDIRYESIDEKLFIKKCIKEKINIKRFVDDEGNLSIKITENKWCIPDFVLDNVVVDVKDFHHWFRDELFNDNLYKYNMINSWCNKNGYVFVFWFKNYGYHTLESIMNIKNENELKDFKLKNIDNCSRYIE